MKATLTLQQTAGLVGAHCGVERRLFEGLGAWSATAPTAPATLVLDRHAQHAAWRAEQWYDRLPVLAGVDRESLVTIPAGWAALGGAPAGLAGGIDDRLFGAVDDLFAGRLNDLAGGVVDDRTAGTLDDRTGSVRDDPFAVRLDDRLGGAVDDRTAGVLDEPAAGDRGSGGTGIGTLAVAYRVLLPRLAVTYARHHALTSPVADGPVIRTLAQVRRDVAADWAEGEAVLQDLLIDAAAVNAAAAAVAAAERRFLPDRRS